MRKHFHPPAELAAEHWMQLETALQGSIYFDTFKKMRDVENRPQKACDVLPKDTVNQGHEMVNMILRGAKLPFRFTRTETWARQNRFERKLAFVHWPPKPVIGE
jgi:hypothetical protein